MPRTKQSTLKKRSIVKKRGGYTNLDVCEYNIYDNNARVNSEDPRELQGIYNTCCPKTQFGLKNSKPFCKNLEGQFKMLQQANNYENKQTFKYGNDRYINSEDEDYYKPRNAIINQNEDEFGPEFQGPTYGLGGRKTRKSRKSRKNKSRKSKKSRKSRKSRK